MQKSRTLLGTAPMSRRSLIRSLTYRHPPSLSGVPGPSWPGLLATFYEIALDLAVEPDPGTPAGRWTKRPSWPVGSLVRPLPLPPQAPRRDNRIEPLTLRMARHSCCRSSRNSTPLSSRRPPRLRSSSPDPGAGCRTVRPHSNRDRRPVWVPERFGPRHPLDDARLPRSRMVHCWRGYHTL